MGKIGLRLGLVLGAVVLSLGARNAQALDKINVGKGGVALIFNILDVGQAAGIWQQVGIDPKGIQFDGEAPLDKAFASGDIDMGLGTGVSMGFTMKGLPMHGVAQTAGPPYDFVLAVKPDSPIKSAADLKGKTIGVTSTGALTWWLAHQMSTQQGWGAEGIVTQPLGGTVPQFAALQHGDIDALTSTPETAAGYVEHQQLRVVLAYGDIIKTFVTHTILASDKMLADHPDQVQRFLKGWFLTIRWLKDPAHHDQVVKVISDTMKISPAAASQAFDIDVKGLSDDGSFDPKGIDMVRETLPIFGVLDKVPPVKGLYDDRFLPVKLDK